MARKKNDTKNQKNLFKQDIPKMLEGYYSGDKPNPNLCVFIEAHIKENPYDPQNDDYDVPAFDKPIETTKATAIYNMHTYWSKKPHDAIRQYIRHYTEPGDMVPDPFCGSGGTALAALMEGRKAIAIDRSPAATFITKNYCTPVDVDKLREAFEELEAEVRPEIDWLYETRCDRCGGKATTGYTVYSQIFQCPRCLEKIPLFDCVDAIGTTAKGKPKKIKTWPYCHEKGIVEEISTRSEKFGAVPVLVSYICEGGCKPKRDKRRHNDPDIKKRMYFEKYDLGKIRKIEKKDIPYWYPPHKMMNVEDDSIPWGDEWRLGRNFRSVKELFTKRNLWALSVILSAIKTIIIPLQRDAIKFCWNSVLLNLSRMTTNRDRLGFLKGTYYLPQNCRCTNVWGTVANKFRMMISGWEAIHSIGTNALNISTEDVRSLNVKSNSINYIFTDPPYADKEQYGELNFVWEAWLGFDTHWHDEEIIVNKVRDKTEADWANMMRQAMAECYRVLKPGHWLSLCYHDTSEGTWALVQDIMAETGFIVDQESEALFIDTGQKSYNQKVADKVNKRDLVINFRKPKPGEARHSVSITGDENAETFSQKVLTIIREYLNEHPGHTKDRIFDAVVSRLVRKGQMEAHDFDTLLVQVAEPVVEPRMKDLFTPEQPDLFGTHEIKRWYLKDTEEGAEESDRAVADAAARKIETFMKKQCKHELKKSQLRWDQLKHKIKTLSAKLAELKMLRNGADEEKAKRARQDRSRLKRELAQLEKEHEKMRIERSEWKKNALHYTYISEFYFPLQSKPRGKLAELLEDYFYFTEQGNWRPPVIDEERTEKQARRAQAVRRRLQSYCRSLESGDAIANDQRPDNTTMAEWIRHCKRSGLYEQGKLLYEKGGLNLDNLAEETMVNVEEDYQVCVRMLARGESSKSGKEKKRSRKKKLK